MIKTVNRNVLGPLSWAIATAAGLAIFAPAAIAQHSSGVAGSATGHISAPVRSYGTPIHSGSGIHTMPPSSYGIRSNGYGASSAPPPSWELPKYVTPQWAIGPNVHINPNPVQGNPIYRMGPVYGVGYVGFPYYGEPLSFLNDDTGGEAAPQQAQPAAPAGAEYGPQEYGAQEPYPQAPNSEEGYYPPARPPYQPGLPAPSAQDNTAAQNDGLDHPAITRVFNDGRPPEKVQSYVLTGSSVFVAEHGHQREIPIADLDLPATIEQNREAGVDFQLPGNSH